MLWSFLKWLIIWVFVAALVIIGSSYIIPLLSHKTTGTSNGNNSSTSTPSINGASSTVALVDFVDNGISRKCTFSNDSPAGFTTGTIFIGFGKVRGDFTITPSYNGAPTVKSYMQNDSEYIFVWGDGDEGFKSPLSDVDAGTPIDEAVNIYEKGHYDCGEWAEATTTFLLPANVVFSQNVITI